MPHRLTHPETGTEIEVDADQVGVYESQGWIPRSRSPKKGGTAPRSTTTKKEEA
jgi:hypothetical protein